MLGSRGVFRNCSPQLSAGVVKTEWKNQMCSRFSCHSSLLTTLAWSSGGCWFKLISWDVDKRDWGLGTYCYLNLWGSDFWKSPCCESKDHVSSRLKTEWIQGNVSAWDPSEKRHIATTAEPLFWSFLCPNNNPHLLNRLKGAGRGLRSAWPKLLLPQLLWHVTWLTETLLANRKGNESMISLHAVKGKTFPFPQNCRPAGSFSWVLLLS